MYFQFVLILMLKLILPLLVHILYQFLIFTL